MAFRNDPVVVGLRTDGPKPTPPVGGPREQKPTPGAEPVDPGASADECRQAYAEFRELAAKTERRWQWIAAISGAAGVGLGAALGLWQGRRSAVAALPESE